MELAQPVVDLQVVIERGSLEAESLRRVLLDVAVVKRLPQPLVADLGEQDRRTDVGDAGVLQMALEDEGDLNCALGGGREPRHDWRPCFARPRGACQTRSGDRDECGGGHPC